MSGAGPSRGGVRIALRRLARAAGQSSVGHNSRFALRRLARAAGQSSVGHNSRFALRRLARAAGQSTVEVVGLLPILLAVVLGAAQLLAAGVANEVADHAAEAGALAILQGGDPADAARAAVPGWARERVHVDVSAKRVAVTVRPPSPFPGLADRLTAHATAHAGGAS